MGRCMGPVNERWLLGGRVGGPGEGGGVIGWSELASDHSPAKARTHRRQGFLRSPIWVDGWLTVK